MDRDEVVRRLKNTKAFPGFTEEELDAIAAAGRVDTASAGTPIIEEGVTGDSLLVVLEGMVDVFKAGTGGERHHLGSSEGGHPLGEIGLLLAHPRSASVVARGDVSYFELGREAFTRLLDEGSSAARKLLQAIAVTLANRHRATNQRLVELIEHGERRPHEVDLSNLRSRFSKSLSYHV